MKTALAPKSSLSIPAGKQTCDTLFNLTTCSSFLNVLYPETWRVCTEPCLWINDLKQFFSNSHTSSDFSEHNLHDFLEEASLTHFCLYLHYSTQSLDFFFRGKEQSIRKWNALEMLRNEFFWFRKKKSTIKTATQCSTPAIKSRQLLKNLILAGPTFLAFRMVNHVSEWLIH